MTIEGREYFFWELMDVGNARKLIPGSRVTLSEFQNPPRLIFMDVISDDVVRVTRRLKDYQENSDIVFFEKQQINRVNLRRGNDWHGFRFRWRP